MRQTVGAVRHFANGFRSHGLTGSEITFKYGESNKAILFKPCSNPVWPFCVVK